jgi:hypothetical protein
MTDPQPMPSGGRSRLPPRPPTAIGTMDRPEAEPRPPRPTRWRWLLALLAKLRIVRVP